jgi:DNA-binding response OmpR family regulator
VLVIEDDALLRGVLCDTLGGAGYRISRAAGLVQALHLLKTMPIDIVVVGPVAAHFLDSGGLMLRRFRITSPGLPIVVVPEELTLDGMSPSELSAADPCELLPRVRAALGDV